MKVTEHQMGMLTQWSNYIKEIFANKTRCEELCSKGNLVLDVCQWTLAGHHILDGDDVPANEPTVWSNDVKTNRSVGYNRTGLATSTLDKNDELDKKLLL